MIEEMIRSLARPEITLHEMLKVAEYTRRKFDLLKEKDSSLDEEEYLPVLFANEVADFLMRKEINKRGEAVCVLSA